MIERLASETKYEGVIATVRSDRFRYPDGSESDREIIEHPGAVGIVALDDDVVWLVRQPREAVGVEDLLEIPAGKLDVEGESPLECAKRELIEEIGREASEWEELKRIFSSPGFAQEEVTIFLARGITALAGHEPNPEERIEIVAWPLADLDEAIAECADAKSVIGLMLLRERLRRP
jgi:8-oxo-dGTP pyrophosphatase MutT (NUDIX family)